MSKTSIIKLPKQRVSEINKEAPVGSRWFYITPKNKVSYYKQLPSGKLACFNKGTQLWDVTSLKEESLRLLPALCNEDFPKENLQEQIAIDLLDIGNKSANAEFEEECDVTITGYTVPPGFINFKNQHDVSYLETLSKNYDKLVSNKEEEDSYFSSKLKNLFLKHLPNNLYEVGEYIVGEQNYFIAQDFLTKKYFVSTSNNLSNTIGTIYTTSLRCANAVAIELNLT